MFESQHATTLDDRAIVDATDFCQQNELILNRVAASGWVVRRLAQPTGQQGVLGCIERHDDVFELMEVGGGFRWSIYQSLVAAITHLRDSIPDDVLEEYPGRAAEFAHRR